MKYAENAGLTSSKYEQSIEEIMIASWNSLKNFASSDDDKHGANEDDKDIKLGKLSKGDECS